MRTTIGLLLFVAAVRAQAQTNDHVFRSWRWGEDISAPRAAGMAGAFVAVGDDSSANILNPAGIALLPKTELAASLLSRGSGTVLGDSLQSRMGIGYVGGAGRLARNWAIGGYLTEPFDSRATLSSTALGDTGFLNVTVTDAGAAAAWHPASRLYVGGRLNVRHLRLQGLWSHVTAAGANDLRVGLATGKDRIAGSAGVLFQATERLRLGAVFHQGASWEVDRKSQSPALGVDLDSSPTALRVPSCASAGASWRLSPRLLLAGQADYVFYGQIQSNLDIRQGAFDRRQYALSNALEARLGAEASWRVSSVSAQLRGGLHSRAPATAAFMGTDAMEAAAFAGSTRRLVATLGGALVTRALRFDVAAMFAGSRTMITAGVAMRF
jgi:long-subunit fatty acid transport protein